MQTTVECPVCVEFYLLSIRVPKTLPCGHGVCEPCVRSLLSAATGPAISCPTCRATCNVPGKHAEKLPTNFPILQLLESLCGDCRDRPHTQKCNHCPLNICDVCRETHQRDLTTDLTNDIRNLNQAMGDLNSVLPDEKNFQKIEDRGDQIIEKITENYNEQKRQLEERYQKSKMAVKAEIQQNIDMLLEWKEKSNKLYFECQSILDRQRFQKLNGKITKQELKRKTEALKQMKDCQPKEVDISSENILLSFKNISIEPTPSLSRETQHTPVPDYFAASYKALYDHQLTWPICICTDPVTSHIIATDFDKHEVIVLSADLQLIRRFGGKGQGDNQYDRPWGVAVNDGQLYICDQWNHKIHVTDLRGVDMCVFGSRSKELDKSDNLCGISCDNAGLLYICDASTKSIKVTDRRGAFVREFGRGVFDGCPWYNAVSGRGRVAVTTHAAENIYVFTTSGQHITTISANTPHNIKTRGVAFDDYGHLLVADCAGGRVAVMTETGDVVCFIGTPGAGPGQLEKPMDLAVTSGGDVIVCDAGNKRIQLFKVPQKCY